MVLPPNPPIVKNGGRPPKCEHNIIRFKRIARTAVEGYCPKCNETLGVIISDPNPERIKTYMKIHLEREALISGDTDVVMGKPRKLSYDERVKLK